MTATIVVAVVGLTGLVACGDDDEAAGPADTQRYCELARQLDEAGEEEIEIDFQSGTPDPEEVRAEMRQFLDDHDDEIDELQRVAPDEISSDVRDLVAALEEVATTGDFAALDIDEGEQRIQEFEERECRIAAEQ